MSESVFFSMFLILTLLLACPVDAMIDNETTSNDSYVALSHQNTTTMTKTSSLVGAIPQGYQITDFAPLADSRTNYYSPDINYGTVTSFPTQTIYQNPYLKFDTSLNQTIASAVLYIYSSNAYNSHVSVYTTGTNWEENTLTYNNKPSNIKKIVASATLYTGWNAINLGSSVLTPGIYSFKIEGLDDVISISSKEGTYAPYLRVNASGIASPAANFSASKTSGACPFSVTFTDTSLGQVNSWFWDFGDNSTSTQQNPTHVYTSSGNFTVNLTAVRSVDGLSGTIIKKNYIKVIPDIRFNNKTNNDSYAFLVNTGNVVKFNLISVKDEINISNYTWYVNKTVQSNNNSSFIFTVPSFDESHPYTGIWEIRVESNYTNGSKLIREWDISALNVSQAPDYFDYFSDLDQTTRTAYTLDPWGRPLLTYNYYSVPNYISKGYVSGTGLDGADLISNSPYNASHGTYRIKINAMNETTAQAILDLSVWDTRDRGMTWQKQLNDVHDYFDFNGWKYAPISKDWLNEAPGHHYWNFPSIWHTFTIVWTEDDWIYLYDNDKLVVKSLGCYKDYFGIPKCIEMSCYGQMAEDNLEIYKNRYIFPPTNITYGQYTNWWSYFYGYQPYYPLFSIENGIIVDGRNVTLKQISDSIKNNALMTYNTNTKTATINTNLFLVSGAELNIKNETLVFNTTSNYKIFRPEAGAILRIQNSTITTTGNNPIVWNFVSADAKTIYDPIGSMAFELGSQDPKGNPTADFRGRLIIENSTIDNTCHFEAEGAHEFTLNNVVFSNTSRMKYGYCDTGFGTRALEHQSYELGNKSFWFVPRFELANYSMKNISFVSPKDVVDLHVLGGHWIQNSTTIRDSDLSNINISSSKGMKLELNAMVWRQPYEPSSISLLNCKYNESKLDVQTAMAEIKTKYYTVVNVTDSLGNPIPNATITFTSSNSFCPAENLYKYDYWFGDRSGDVNATGPGAGGTSNTAASPSDQISAAGGWFQKWSDTNPLGSIKTGSNGRTALSIEDVNKSIVLTDFVLTNETGVQSKESIKYNLTISPPNYRTFYLQDVDPDSTWYRKSPLSSEYNITAIVPDSSEGPHIIGFAPGVNQFKSSEKIIFRVWTDGSLTDIKWYAENATNNMTVAEGVLNYTSNVSDNFRRITFSGKDAKGNILTQIWELSEESGGTSSKSLWDVNKDGFVDIIDIVLITNHYSETYTNKPYPGWDVNQDGTINIQDLYLVEQHFGKVSS